MRRYRCRACGTEYLTDGAARIHNELLCSEPVPGPDEADVEKVREAGSPNGRGSRRKADGDERSRTGRTGRHNAPRRGPTRRRRTDPR